MGTNRLEAPRPEPRPEPRIVFDIVREGHHYIFLGFVSQADRLMAAAKRFADNPRLNFTAGDVDLARDEIDDALRDLM